MQNMQFVISNVQNFQTIDNTLNEIKLNNLYDLLVLLILFLLLSQKKFHFSGLFSSIAVSVWLAVVVFLMQHLNVDIVGCVRAFNINVHREPLHKAKLTITHEPRYVL